MKKTYLRLCVILLWILILGTNYIYSQNEYEVKILDNPFPGYLKLDRASSLIDNYGYPVFKEQLDFGTNSFKLLKNGLWAQGELNSVYLYDKDLRIVDTINNPTSYIRDSHDLISLSNGHYLLLCIEYITMDLSKEIEGGDSKANIISNVLVETDATGNIYWKWRAIEHTNIKDVVDDIPLDQNTIDFTHINSLDEDANGNILISIRHFDEIALINKSTGNFIWRFGGSKCKNNQFTFTNDIVNGFFGFSHQHCASILPNGNILLYDNGNLKSPQYSRAVEYSLNLISKTATKVWEYRNTPDIFNSTYGSVYRLDNGNSLVNFSNGKIVEVRPNKTLAFELNSLLNGIYYRVQKINLNTVFIKRNISSKGYYDFNDDQNNTEVILNLDAVSGNSPVYVQKHSYSPPTGEYADSSFSAILPYRWVITHDDSLQIAGTISINANTIKNSYNPELITIFQRSKEALGIFQELNTTYISSTGQISARFTGFGEFALVSNVLSKPILSTPLNNSIVLESGSLNWNKLPGAMKYQLQIDTLESFAQPVVNQLIEKKLSYDYNDLYYNTKYFWRIRGLNNKDTSEWSTVFSFTTVISYPELIYPTNNFVGIKLSDSLKWNVVPGAESYLIQISKVNNFTNPQLIIESQNNYAELVSKLGFNTNYYWRVKAIKSTDSSHWSEVRNFTTTLAAPVLLLPLNDTINIQINSNLSWIPVNGAGYYNIELSETSDFKSIIFQIFNNKTTSQKYSNLKYNKQYYWRVKALREYDSSSWSEILSFTTLLQSPELISPLNQSTNISENTVISWKALEPSNSSSLQVSLSADFKKLIVDTNSFLSNQFVLIDLKTDTKYYWRVKSNYGKQVSEWSDSWSFTTGKISGLIDPKLSHPKNNSEVQINGYFSWVNVDKAIKYKLQLSLSANFDNTIIDTNINDAFIYYYSNLQYEKEYYWRVKAYSINDSSLWSEVWTFITRPVSNTVSLLKPGNDALQIPLTGKFEWNSITEISNYQIQVSETPDFQTFVYNIDTTRKNNFDYSDLKLNNRYYWKVRFVKDTDTSNWSNIWSFTTVDLDSLPIPALLNPIDGKKGYPVNGVLSWSEVKDANKYQISLSKNRNFNNIFLKNSDIEETIFIYSNLEYNHTYFWRVSALADNAKSAWSAERSFLTELENPVILYPYDNLIAQPIDGGILWSVSEDISLYHLQIATDSTFINVVTDIDNIYEMSYNYNLPGNTIYYCRVKSYNDTNQSRWSNIVRFETDNSTSVKDNEDNRILRIFPNPVSNILNIIVDNKEYPLDIKIYNLMGNSVLSLQLNSFDDNIDVSNLCSGVYIIAVNDKKRIFIKN